ncbi:hypothetical protein GCM10009798_13940 [Nocardioides panacihumi]|uniref:STAS domain-containing protein n=1 Tax=Nocardioides panacihumi TaxID=400774 RepID=A0ABN2QPI8_9ACTN
MSLGDSISVPGDELARAEDRPDDTPGIVRRHKQGSWLVIEPEGELDITTVPLLRRSLKRHAARVVFDLGRVTFVDASFLDFLAQIVNHQAHGHCTVRVARPSPQARRLLEFTALNLPLEVYGSLDEALA